MQFLNQSICDQGDTCLSKEISAPIFIENNECKVNWGDSKYMGDNGDWISVDKTSDFSIRAQNGKQRVEVSILTYCTVTVLKPEIKPFLQPKQFKPNIFLSILKFMLPFFFRTSRLLARHLPDGMAQY